MKKNIVLLGILTTIFVGCKKEKDTTDTNQKTLVNTELQEDTKIVKATDGVTTHIIKSGVEKSCHQVLKNIITSLKQYQKEVKGLEAAIIKNGGSGIGINIERQIGNKQEKNSNDPIYVYNIVENYQDHTTAIATYLFNIKTKKLYQKHFILDEVIEIDFNQNYLKDFDLYCE